MTDAEREMLRDIHRALMEPPIGGGSPLINQIAEVCQAYHRGRWAARAILWGLPTLAMIGASIQAIRGWFQWPGQ